MFYWLTGIPGVGKTTALHQTLSARDWNDQIIRMKGSDILLELAGIQTLSELSRLDQRRRQQLTERMYSRMLKIDRQFPNRIHIDDGHFTIPLPEGNFRTVLPEDERIIERSKMVILLQASEWEILQRLSTDPARYEDRLSRYRHIHPETTEAIRRYQRVESQVVSQWCNDHHIPFMVIDNHELDNAVTCLITTIEHKLDLCSDYRSYQSRSPEL